MCLAVPTLITSVVGSEGRSVIGGVERTISLALTPEVKVGDYVLVHAGFAISVLDEDEAMATLDLLQELAESSDDQVLASAVLSSQFNS
jgi:hydrogenase expression/formation protein HypC